MQKSNSPSSLRTEFGLLTFKLIVAMITLLIGGLLILWLVKMGWLELSKNLFSEEGISETEIQ